ncbi:GntR family transcriptional regulator [Devosia sp.]|uniref:GntR family transcriptional regulator n=1 Tax=Devosia sp. TaxID=1871048 RepID=UPI002734B4B1|nr:GntR family transcriptional regulator [Devosia sp.]MDP2782746.1 GntR family transcriptional regulator [Devosia sp.]
MAVENFLQRLPVPPTRAPSARRSHNIYVDLQREIVLGMLAPRSVLLELELASRFEVSQGTVREALLLLQEEGLVHRLPHRGTTVADCRADDAEELIRLRHDIECRGARRAVARYGVALAEPMRRHLAAMQAAAASGDEYLLSVHDRAFHAELFDCADLPPVQPVLARCLVHAHRFKILHPAQNRDLLETANRHQVIIDALASAEVEQVVAALSHHITTIVDFGPNILGAGA